MAQFGEVIHCHKPPYSGIPGEDFVNVRFASQDAADRAYAALKTGTVFVDGFPVGIGPTQGGNKGSNDGPLALGNGNNSNNSSQQQQMMRRRSPSPPRRYGRNRQRSPVGRRPSPPPRRDNYREREREREPRPPARSPSPTAMPLRGNFPSRNDPKSPSPRRLAREMNLSTHSRSRSRQRERRHREDRGNEFSGGLGQIALMRVKDKPRSPSPEPPGPAKNPNVVKNPFFRGGRSPSPEL